ncbi:hypothetical protein BG000_005031 [Podila horticola]|nr:hypothetical protein BG000_005031 [Podila horticola]
MTDNILSLFCLVDGEATSNSFSIKIPSSDAVDDLKNLIKAALSPQFNDNAAKDLTLWRVSIPVVPANKTNPINLTDIISATQLAPTDDISDVFQDQPPKKTIHIIVQRPPQAISSNKRKRLSAEADGRIVRPKLSVEPYDGRESSMVFVKDKFQGFPLNDKRSFETIRANAIYAYFDRTSYISVLDSFLEDVLLFLRPRRFGKSLFLSTLAHFHGVEYKNSYMAMFQSPDLTRAWSSLRGMIVSAIKAFYQKYGTYLGDKSSDQLIASNVSQDPIGSLSTCIQLVEETLTSVMDENDPLYGVKGIYLLADEYDAFSNEFLDPNNPRPWEQLHTSPGSLLKGFWATVKSNLGPRQIVKCFITGVSPLSMADHTSGFNVATYVSWREELSGLCGLREEDVLAALRLTNVCKSEDEILNHFEIMKANYDGYNFAELSQAPHVFNTNTCLEYLEVSEPALQILAASPVASSIISDSLGGQIPYEGLVQSFRLTHLASEIATSKPAWLSYMLHIGGLTFCRDDKQLRIPNLVAAERFGNATLHRHGLRLQDVDLAFQNVVSTGNICQALILYRQAMSARDVGFSDFEKKEEHHRDSFYYALLGNSHPSLRKIELEVKVSKRDGPGRVDMQILVPSKKRILVLEWKVVQIDYLEVQVPVGVQVSREEKAKYLSGVSEASAVLDLKFGQNDRWRSGQTIRDWISVGPHTRNSLSPRQQLAEYVSSPEINKLRQEHEVTGYLIVVVGSREILSLEMSLDGQFRKDPLLAI